MTPGLSYLIPLFTLFQVLGLIGTVWPIALTHMVITLPIVVWIMIGFFETQPHELEEAARIDGATRLGVLFKIVLPLSTPALATLGVITFMLQMPNQGLTPEEATRLRDRLTELGESHASGL
jgi:multiple sugar transport system permease protein